MEQGGAKAERAARGANEQTNGSGVNMTHHATFRINRQIIAEIWPFVDFLKWRPSAMLDFLNFEIIVTVLFKVSMCVTVPNFVQSVLYIYIKIYVIYRILPYPRYGNLFDFQDGGRPPSWIFKKFKILTAHALRRAKVRYDTQFCADRSNRCGDMAVFLFFKMAAVRHLGFIMRLFGPPMKCFWWSLSLCKIWFESVQ